MNNLIQLVDAINNRNIILYSDLKKYKKSLYIYLSAYCSDYNCDELMYIPTDSYGFGGLVCNLWDANEQIENYLDGLDLDDETKISSIEVMQFNTIPFKNL